MTIDVAPSKPSVRAATPLYDATKHLPDRVVLAALFVILLFFNYATDLVDTFAKTFAVDSELAHSRTASGAELLGLVAIAVVLKDLKSDRVLRRWDYAAIIGIALASIYPSPLYRAMAITCLGALFIARSDKRLASLGQLCIGLAWINFWGAIALSLIAQWLLPIETVFAYLPLSFAGSFSLNGTIISNDTGFALMVAEPCSAFHNTITASFIWLSLIKIQRLDFQLKHFIILAIGLAAVVLLNTARIGIMAVSESQYFFWHMDPGLWIVKVMMLIAVLSIFYFGLGSVQRRERGPVGASSRETNRATSYYRSRHSELSQGS